MSIELNAVTAADFSAGGGAPKGAEPRADAVDFLNVLLGALRVDPESSEGSPTIDDAAESAHEPSLPDAEHGVASTALPAGAIGDATASPMGAPAETSSAVEVIVSGDATDSVQEVPASIGAIQSQERPSAIDPADRSLERVAPELRERVERVMERMRDEFGHKVAVVEGYRTSARQDHLYAQGRSAPGRITTWTRRSWHTDGLAADLQVDGSYENNLAYARLQRVAREEGLRTLGPMDRGHVELPDSRFAVQPDAAPGPTRRFVGVATPAAPAAVAAVAAVATPGSWIEIPAALPQTPAAIPAPVPLLSPELGTNVPGQSGIGASRGGPLPADTPGAAVNALSATQSVGQPVDLVGVAQASSEVGVPAHTVPTVASPRLAHPTEAAAPRTGAADAVGAGPSQSATVGALDGGSSMWAGASADPDRESGPDGGSRRDGAAKGADARAVAGVDSAAGVTGGAVASSGSPAATSTGPVTPAAGAVSGPSPLDRVERIEELRELARSAQPGRIAIRLDGAGSDQVRVGLLNRAVAADLDISNPESAARIRGRVAELHRALEGRGLELGSMTVNGVNAAQTAAGGWPGVATDGSADILRALFASDRGDTGGDGQGRGDTTHEQRPDRGGQERPHRGKPEEELN